MTPLRRDVRMDIAAIAGADALTHIEGLFLEMPGV